MEQRTSLFHAYNTVRLTLPINKNICSYKNDFVLLSYSRMKSHCFGTKWTSPLSEPFTVFFYSTFHFVKLCAVITRPLDRTVHRERTYAVVLWCPRGAWTPWWQLLPGYEHHSLLHPSPPSVRACCLWCLCRILKPPRKPNWPVANCSPEKQHSRGKKKKRQNVI